MIYDIHAHAVGSASLTSDSAFPTVRRGLLFRCIARRVGLRPGDLKHLEALHAVRQQTLAWLEASAVDRVVFLALDAARDHDAKVLPRGTQLFIPNDDVAAFASSHPKARFGASVHPYRRDAVIELERVIHNGACLIKWLPSAQNIQPDDPVCFPFYEAMAHHRIPLLCHTGNEHTLGTFSNALNQPCRLKPALKMGVTVIAAHCGARLYLHEKCYFRQWAALAEQYEHFFGDISAFGLPTRATHLRRILNSPLLSSKVLYGSDFPVRAFPMGHIFRMGVRKARALGRVQNPFDRPLQMMRALGVPREVFTRAGFILRLRRGESKEAAE